MTLTPNLLMHQHSSHAFKICGCEYSAIEETVHFCFLHNPWAVHVETVHTSSLLATHFRTGIRKPSLDRSLSVNFTALFAHEVRYVLRYQPSLFLNFCFFYF